MVLSDEIYGRLLFEGEPFSISPSVEGIKDRTIILDGFSKTYAMTGWRMGYGVMRADLADARCAPDDQFQLLHRPASRKLPESRPFAANRLRPNTCGWSSRSAATSSSTA